MDFLLYVEWGMERVIDFRYTGHLLYFTALAIAFTHREWQKISAITVVFFSTFFCSLFLSTYDVYESSRWLVSFLIPICIVLAALCNYIYTAYDTATVGFYFHAFVAFFSGFLHGLSFFHRFELSISMQENKFNAILGLTVGTHLGQILVTIAVFVIASLFLDRLGIKRLKFMSVFSAVIIAIAISMIVKAYP